MVEAALSLADPGAPEPLYGFYPRYGALVNGASYVAWLGGQLFDGNGTPTLDHPSAIEATRTYAALIARANLVICPDSGPAHMATALGTTVVGLYATSNPARTGPYMSQKFTINRYPDAIRRYLDKNEAEVRWGQRVRDPDAMALIEASDVTEKIDLFFDDRGL